MAKIFLGIRVEPETKARIERVADAQNRPISNLIETWILERLAMDQKQQGETK